MTQIAKIVDIKTNLSIGNLNEGDKIIRAKDSSFTETIEINTKETYVKLFTKTMFILAKELSGSEMQFIHYLLQFLRYESGLISYENGKELCNKSIALEIGKSVRWVEMTMKSLEEKQVLHKIKIGKSKYLANPWLFMRGKRITKTLYEIFKDTKWAKLYNKRSANDE